MVMCNSFKAVDISLCSCPVVCETSTDLNKMPVALEYNYEQAKSDMDIFSENDINELRQWIQTFSISKIIPKDLSDKQLLLFYNACYGDLEKTKVCVEKYYSCRRNAPEFFDHRALQEEELRITTETVKFFVIPGKSCEGYDIVYHGFQDSDPSKFHHLSVCKLLIMAIDLCLSKRGPQSGFIFLFDMKGVKFGHLTRMNLIALPKIFQYVQGALPVRMKAIHVLNTEPIADKFMTLMSPFIDKKLFDMIKFHSKTEDPEKLYEVIPKSSLPSDYGGTLSDTHTLHKECIEELRLLEPYFRAEQEQRYAALPDKLGQNTLEGTFRQLDID